MPFWGRDWRSPGDLYLKNSDGYWIKAKQCRQTLLESLNDDFLHRIIRRSLTEDESTANEYKEYINETHGFQPHFFLKREATKESGPRITLIDALCALNFKTALKDDRRFLYVCKTLQVLIQNKMHLLSGRTQIYLLELLQEAVKEVKKNGNYVGITRELLTDLKESLKKNKYQHIGSNRLWSNHWDQLNDMEKALADLSEKKENIDPQKGCKLEELPPECIQRILSHLPAPQDLEMAGGASCQLQTLVEDELLWRRLVLFNFSQEQIKAVLPWRTRSIDDCNSKAIYRRLLKRFGDRHFYSTRLNLCDACKCVYWPVLGHPCNTASTAPKTGRDLTPPEFIDLFVM